MNKKILSFLLVLALGIALLAGCTSASATTQEPSETVVTAPVQNTTRQPASVLPTELAAPAATPVLCEVCGDYGCDDGAFCDDWDEKWENLKEQENIRINTPCEVCGDYDCDDGVFCDDWDDRYEHHHHSCK